MKEAVIEKGPKVHIIDSPIPSPKPGQVVIKVVVSGSNPKDWKVPQWMPDAPPMNQGDDIAGTVYAVADDVIEFKVGDRVAAFHQMLDPHGSYAEYAVAWAHTTFLLPEKTSFEGMFSNQLNATMTEGLWVWYRGCSDPISCSYSRSRSLRQQSSQPTPTLVSRDNTNPTRRLRRFVCRRNLCDPARTAI